MTLSIKNTKTAELVKELVQLTGESKTQVVIQALEERLARLRKGTAKNTLAERLLEIAREFDELPVFDDRSPDEILGYDENGLPT